MSSEARNKLVLYEPILQVKEEGKDVRSCFTEFIMAEWRDRFEETFLKVALANNQFAELKNLNQKTESQLEKIDVKVKNMQSEYILAKTVETIL